MTRMATVRLSTPQFALVGAQAPSTKLADEAIRADAIAYAEPANQYCDCRSGKRWHLPKDLKSFSSIRAACEQPS